MSDTSSNSTSKTTMQTNESHSNMITPKKKIKLSSSNSSHTTNTTMETFKTTVNSIEVLKNPNDENESSVETEESFAHSFQNNELLSLDPSFKLPKYHETSIDELMGSNPPYRRTVIYLILLRVVAAGERNESRTFSLRNIGKKYNGQSSASYTRLLLCMDPRSKFGDTVYIVQGRGISTNLWVKNANIRDNGILSIGSLIAIFCPKPITKLLANEVPIVETNMSALVLKRTIFANIDIDHAVPENTTRGFIMNNCRVEVETVDVIETKCCGHFCDKQRSAELMRAGKPCGCYQMRAMHSNLSLLHRIRITEIGTLTEDINCDLCEFVMDEYSSMKFSLLYLTEYFPHTTKRNIFDGTEELDDLYKCIDEVMKFYNENGGFTIIGWYKRGEINDTSMSDEKLPEKISSSILSHHVVSIYPSKFLFEHDEAEDIKYDVLNISKNT